MPVVRVNLMRPFKFATVREEFEANRLIFKHTGLASLNKTEDDFFESNRCLFFSDNERTPQGVMTNIFKLMTLKLNENATIREFVDASIKLIKGR